MLVHDPVERAFSKFLEECQKGSIGWSCTASEGSCSVAECEYSASQRGRSTCSKQPKIPGELKKMGGVCSPAGFEQFLFGGESGLKPRSKGKTKLLSKILKVESQYEDLKYFSATHHQEEDENIVDLYLTSKELLHDPKTAKKELEMIESFLGRQVQSPSNSAVVEKVNSLEKLYHQQASQPQPSILAVSSATVGFLQANIAPLPISQKGHKPNLRGGSSQHHAVVVNKRQQHLGITSSYTSSLISPAVLSYLKNLLCPEFQRLEDLIIATKGLYGNSKKRLADLLGHNSCSTGAWWSQI
uniref:Uncharacterized protein n=1 Tax=Heterosigma akashiwo TaxID=2829 RepID=A0A7S3XPN7_HETAK